MEVLPFRIRGTRVCIFASRFLTFALISDTICTPLLLATVCGIPVVGIDEYGVPGMRVGNRAGVFRAGRREGEASDGRVVDRLIGVDGVPGAGSLVVRGVPNPARCSKADLPASEELSDEADVEAKYNRALEEKIILEHELLDKANLEEECQRLKDDLRGSYILPLISAMLSTAYRLSTCELTSLQTQMKKYLF